MIVRWPEGIHAPGRTVHALVEAVDVLPTLLQCAGIPVPYSLQGRSFLPLLGEGSDCGRRSALTEMNGWKTLRLESTRYVVHEDGREMLYDLEEDPGAYHDVATEAAYAGALNQARREMLRRLLERERPIPRTWPY
jgi:arylsulfatase A-like enzyme